tara:strand:+ start:1167 stop:1370 length:204 start_codon:yes stop_codon:yes gene_type:complete
MNKHYQVAFSCPKTGETKIHNTQQLSFANAASFSYVKAHCLQESTKEDWTVVAIYDMVFDSEKMQLS